MRTAAIRTAIDEAKRFIGRAEDLLIADADSRKPESLRALLDRCVVDHPKEQGATRRASMDLTRALAEMRRAG